MARVLPLIRVDERKASDAYAVHRALLKAERDDPSLRYNPSWQLIRLDAYETFCKAFEVLL